VWVGGQYSKERKKERKKERLQVTLPHISNPYKVKTNQSMRQASVDASVMGARIVCGNAPASSEAATDAAIVGGWRGIEKKIIISQWSGKKKEAREKAARLHWLPVTHFSTNQVMSTGPRWER
jgi:hypothetical protein